MAKIVIDARELSVTAGTGRYIERLLHYLQAIDKTNKYLVLLKPKDMDSWRPQNRKFQPVACPYKEFSFAEQVDLRRQIKKLQPDLVHFSVVQQPIFYRGKVVTTVHDLTTTRFRNPAKNWLVFTFKQLIYKWVIKVAARQSNAIITPSEFVKDEIARFAKINSRKITVTHEAADRIEAEPEPLADLENKAFLLYVGRPHPHKNLDRLIEAFASVQQSRPELYLVLAGQKSVLYRRLESRVKSLGLEHVYFPGFVSDSQLRWLYEHARAYVFPSLSEGFGLPGLEAMRHGLPVISSNTAALPEIYQDAALYFDPTNTLEMANKIEELLAKPKLAQKLMTAGYKVVAQYSWKRMAEQTLTVYNEVLNS